MLTSTCFNPSVTTGNDRRPLWFALVAASLLGSPAHAAEWSAEPSVTVRGEYDDNFRLAPGETDSVYGAIVEPRLALNRRTEIWDASANGRLRAARYDKDQFNTVDSFLDLSGQRRFQRGSVSASVGVANDTTLQNEYLDFDTGVTVNQIDRMRTNVRLAGQYMFTEATWLELSATYIKTDYEDGETYGLLDYDYVSPALRVAHRVNPKTQVFAIYSHSNADYDSERNLESETDSLQLGAAYDITETWKLSGSVGSRRTETSQLALTGIRLIPTPPFQELVYEQRDTKTTGLVFDASLERQFEAGSLSLTASRSMVPGSTGTEVESTRFGATATRRFSPQLSAQLAVSYLQSETVGGVTTRADTDRYRIAPSVAWRITEEWRFNAGYVHTRVERDVANDADADSNLVYMSVGYTWPRLAVSR